MRVAGGLAGILLRAQRAELQCMHRSGQFLRQRGIDGALPLDAALAGEAGGNQFDAEMTLAARPRAGMAVMAVGIIEDGEPGGREGRFELGADALGDGHSRKVSAAGLICNGLSVPAPAPILR